MVLPARTRGPNKGPHPVRTTMHRIRISETMHANKNASAESFVDELTRTYSDVPELVEWLLAHADDLKRANTDGSVPKSAREMICNNELQLYTQNLPSNGY